MRWIVSLVILLTIFLFPVSFTNTLKAFWSAFLIWGLGAPVNVILFFSFFLFGWIGRRILTKNIHIMVGVILAISSAIVTYVLFIPDVFKQLGSLFNPNPTAFVFIIFLWCIVGFYLGYLINSIVSKK